MPDVVLDLTGFAALALKRKQLLAQAISPPKQEQIELVIAELYTTGAIAAEDEAAAVTDFGRVAAADLPVDLSSAKLIYMGFTFDCLLSPT